MAAVTYIEHNGKQHQVEVNDGISLMDGAISNMVRGIIGECGGGLACATCHCYVDDAWIERLTPPSDTEKEMLESVAAERRPGSRLSCQIPVEPGLDGLVVRLPATQF
ncbi:2Fe-2S iron-sulfur cluster-binding protein [Solimonas terrae]|uniref:2Fe-2S iron-sulfur cluster binding domain-containing protein n=1 Tax=Solimonas terrae TaxID=1396819 RepID=A0A6M2BNX0_9GAMM|nr:2Fe-2S iron-sulfur cluster binding domain-containing protein [Solimonas terrae]